MFAGPARITITQALSGPVLRDTARLSQRYPPIARYGFLVSQHGQLGAIPLPLFLSVSPLESMRSGGAIPPPQKGYLSDTCAIPYENKATGCDTPLCDTISKGYCAIWGGISHWVAKHRPISQFKAPIKVDHVAMFFSNRGLCFAIGENSKPSNLTTKSSP